MIKAIILDDNIHAIDNLKDILVKLGIDVVAKTTQPGEVIGLIKLHQPDIVFLDIDLGENKATGIELTDKIVKVESDIVIVYATGHAEYALKTYETDAIYTAGYILKPFNRIKVSRALNKAIKIIDAKKKMYLNKNNETNTIKFKDKDNAMHFIEVDNIIFIERENNGKNTIIHFLANKMNTIKVTESLKSIEMRLSKFPQFIKSHKSFIINKNRIHSIHSISVNNRSSCLVKFKKYKETALIVKSKIGLVDSQLL